MEENDLLDLCLFELLGLDHLNTLDKVSSLNNTGFI